VNGSEAPVEPVAAISDEGAERVAAAVLAQDAIAADAGVEPTISVIAADEDAVNSAEEKPRRARRSRKSPDADGAVQDAVTEGESSARPRGRGRRAKAAPPTEEEAIQSAEAIAVAVPEPIAEPVAVAEDRPSRSKKELPPDQIVVSSSTAAPAEEKPKKAGWWQRGFFGG